MKLFVRIVKRIQCFFGKHEWKYMWGNYQTGKDLFRCRNCGKEIEQ